MNQSNQTNGRKLAVAIAIGLPTVVTWIYFHLLADHPAQKVAYSIGKGIQFAFPIAWVLLYLKQSWWAAKLPDSDDSTDTAIWSRGTSLAFGIGMGLAVSAAMYGVFLMIPAETIADLSTELAARIQTLGFDSPTLFIGMGVFYALIHSFLEEYYFRWFVFGQLRHVMGFVPSMVISGLAFMAHHVIVLAMYFGWSGLTAFLSLSIAIGGMIWAWQYEKSRSLLGPWISHLLVDAGIFAIGYHVLRSSGAL